jgi:hypothetical protein
MGLEQLSACLDVLCIHLDLHLSKWIKVEVKQFSTPIQEARGTQLGRTNI